MGTSKYVETQNLTEKHFQGKSYENLKLVGRTIIRITETAIVILAMELSAAEFL